MRHTKKPNNLKTVFIFCVLVFILIFISTVFKTITLVKQSKFDGKHTLNVQIDTTSSSQVISFAPEKRTIHIVTIQKDSQEKKQISKLLEVPIDGFIMPSEKKKVPFLAKFDESNISDQLLSTLVNIRSVTTNLTILDIMRLFMFSKSISSKDILLKEINASFEDVTIDKISSSVFSENTILQEKVSIQIINGTDIVGLGNRFARLVGNIGGNVVAVSTSDDIVTHSHIRYFGEPTYTLERLSRILQVVPTKSYQQTVSDIVIIIGKNKMSSMQF